MDIYYFIDRLKGLCHITGLFNQTSGEEILRNLFLYKILCDRFDGAHTTAGGLRFEEHDHIRNAGESPQWLDDTFQRLGSYEENNRLCLSPVLLHLMKEEKRDMFYKGIKTVFTEADPLPENGGDYFMRFYEYLNVVSGRYAEYYTPMEISQIIGEILTDGETRQGLSLYDPSAGTGSLLLNVNLFLKNAHIFGQDISQKSTNLLNMNLLLNQAEGMVCCDDTLLYPYFRGPFDYIVANPPFKTDFSYARDKMEKSGYFPFGVPKVPTKKKESMATYLCFMQHIIQNMGGKAAVVVPLSFLSISSGIARAIREHIIKERMLAGVLAVPKNIFANTATRVAVVFLDKQKCSRPVLLDVSKEGHLEKQKNNSRVVFGKELAENIVDRFLHDASCRVSADAIENHYCCSFLPGHYADPAACITPLSDEDWAEMKTEYKKIFHNMIKKEQQLNEQLMAILES